MVWFMTDTNLDSKLPNPPAKTRGESLRSIFSTIGLIILAPILALLISAFVLQSYQVDGQSMEKTLQNNDRLIVNKLPRTLSRIGGHAYIPKRGDIIIFNQSGLNAGFGGQKQLIKRVVGLPGERVIIKDGVITVYNKAQPDGFKPDFSGLYHIDAVSTPGNVDVELSDNQLFVCGDNRTNSEDSRYFGPIEAKNIVGRLSIRVLPLGKPHHP